DGERLEDKLALELPDVLLLDVVMPNRNGYDILRHLKKDERTRHTPVVLVTCRSEESDRLWGKRQGADEYVTKPFTPAELLTVVTRFTTEPTGPTGQPSEGARRRSTARPAGGRACSRLRAGPSPWRSARRGKCARSTLTPPSRSARRICSAWPISGAPSS